MSKVLIFLHITFLLFCGSINTFAKSRTTKINNSFIYVDQLKSDEKNKTLQIEAIDVDFYEDLHADQDETFLSKPFTATANCVYKWYHAYLIATNISSQQILCKPYWVCLQNATVLYLHHNVFRI